MKPRISVLIPSRGRVVQLEASLVSLGWHKYEPMPEVEFLIALDEDDPQVNLYKERLGANTTIITMPRVGYGYLDKYYNELAKVATGDWLWLWNDDATMREGPWLERLKEVDASRPYIAQFGGHHIFPLMTRTLYKTIGHFSKGASNDTYMLGLGDRAGVRIYIGTTQEITIDHNEIHDQTETDKNATLGIATGRPGWEDQDKDAERIKQWLAKHQ
jgi:hypothetical protein